VKFRVATANLLFFDFVPPSAKTWG